MSRNVIAAIVGVLAMSVELGAHRLDEYLQAARVALARDAIALEVDMTPGRVWQPVSSRSSIGW